ncbi:hypothetical protein ACI78T_06750 [Blastococcus sp. SYSU D00922]
MDLRGMARDARRLGTAGMSKMTPAEGPPSMAAMLERHGLPAAPATSHWELSVSALVSASGQVNPVARRALAVLDRFGRVAVGPLGIGLDDEDIPWSAVTALHTAPVSQVLTESALDRELERLLRVLPPLPGRSWVLERVGSVLGGLLGRALPTDGALGAEVVTGADSRRRLGRTSTTSLGFVGTLLLAALPQVDLSFRATAASHGVNVLPAGRGAWPAKPPADAARMRESLGRRFQGLDGTT